MKKTIAMMLVIGLATSQIGCAGKVTKISAPIDEVEFNKDYNYTVIVKGGKTVPNIPGEKIETKSHKLSFKNQTEEKIILDKDIYQINGISKLPQGTKAVSGLVTGGSIGGGLGAFAGVLLTSVLGCEDDNCTGAKERIGGILALTGVGAGIGGLLGLGIGALTPKYNKIQITPIVSPSNSGVDAGVNVGIKF